MAVPAPARPAARSRSRRRSRSARSIPVAMQDLGGYGIVAQCFEFLATLGDNGEIAPGLAESWEPNDDGTVWTFKLRQGRQVAGRHRLHVGRRRGHDGPPGRGRQRRPQGRDRRRVRSTPPIPPSPSFTLAGPERQLPVPRVGVQRPVGDHARSTTRPAPRSTATPNGTGPWKLVELRPGDRAPSSRATTPGGAARRRWTATEFQFFDDLGTMVTAAHGGRGRRHRPVPGRSAATRCSTTPTSTCWSVQAATHRQIWMRCDTGQFTDKRVRQALALTFDRPAMIETLFKGKAELGNDHVIAPFYPVLRRRRSRNAEQDIDKAKQLLPTPVSPTPLSATLHFGDLQEIPQLAQLIQAGARRRVHLELAGESLDTFYGAQWCPADPADPPCSGAAELGIVDYGHRPVPDVYLNAALATNGDLELVAVLVARVRRRVHGVPGRDRRRRPDGGLPRRSRRSSTRTRRSACRTSTTTSPATRRSSRASGFSARPDVPRQGLAGLSTAPSVRSQGAPRPWSIAEEEHDRMTRYVLRRVLLSIVTLWLIVTIVFMIVNVLPERRRAAASPGRSRRRRPSTRSTSSSARTTRSRCSTGAC